MCSRCHTWFPYSVKRHDLLSCDAYSLLVTSWLALHQQGAAPLAKEIRSMCCSHSLEELPTGRPVRPQPQQSAHAGEGAPQVGTLTIKETLQSSVWGQSSRLEMIITGTSGWLGSDGIWGVKPLQPHGCLNKSCLEKIPSHVRTRY